MIAAAYLLLSIAAILFVVRLLLGPSVADRIIALDGLLVTILAGVLVNAAWVDSAVSIDTVLVVALLGFVATGVLARYIEQRGG
ncbi:monovalent cation/H+ antiporter complex subunit F [Ilumatobacter sp.]|uniref:monovalent cation/H+ antiporter complex subunit F n=1 Tax=Ilumatobacter sp. TaxID=1967498 RepID=UPI003AF6EDEC